MHRNGLRRPRRLPLPLALCGLLWLAALPACEENLDAATPDGSLHRLRNAVVKKDAPAILEASSAETLASLKELHALLTAQARTINETYPEEFRVAARTSYPPGALEAKSPEALFSVLLEGGLKELNASPGLAYGMTAQGRPSIAAGGGEVKHASVTSQAGETYEFVLQNGVWKSTVFEREIAAQINHARLYQQTMDDNLKVVAELRRVEQMRAARDPGAPPSGAPR